MSYWLGGGLGQRRLLCGPYTHRPSVLGTSTARCPDLSPAAKVSLPAPTLAVGPQEGFGRVWQKQDLLKLGDGRGQPGGLTPGEGSLALAT